MFSGESGEPVRGSEVYSRLYNEWFRKVFRVYAVGFVIVVAAEVIGGIAMGYLGSSDTALKYILRRVIAPSLIDGILILLNLLAFKIWHISKWLKNSIAIGVLIVIAAVLSCVHNFFEARFVLFLVPIVASMAFASVRFMLLSAAASLAGVWISLFLPLLWHDEFNVGEQAVSACLVTLAIIVIAVIERIILQLFLEREKIVQKLTQENIRLGNEAMRDELTGLYNRKGFVAKAGEHIKNHPEAEHILLVCDISNFKGINEKIGEQGADDLLKHFADCMRATSTATDNIFGRYGGDQFVWLLDKAPDKNEEQLMKWNRSVIETAGYRGFTVKYGVRRNVKADESIVTVCDQARTALATIKNDYQRYVAIYDPAMKLQRDYQQVLENYMREGLEQEQFKVYFQPKHDAGTGRLVGAEALVRWEHPELGFIAPDKFIPLFEKNGFISQVDLYVWGRVCKNLRKWQDMGLDIVPVSVNLSRRDILEFEDLKVLDVPVESNRLEKKYLHIEVTESMYIDDEDNRLLNLVNDARNDGFAVELDDFGSGYSSLGVLGDLPIDVIKLDMSFVKNLNSKLNVVKAVIYLAKTMGVKTIAEGVETEEQLETLKSLKCDYIQGYYFSRPLPEEEFLEYMKVHTR